MTSIFNTIREYPQMHVWCKFGDSSPNLWRVIVRTNRNPDACLGQIWWFQLKPVTSYRADKVKFTDGRMDGQTDGQTQATTIPLRPERPRGKKRLTFYITHKNRLAKQTFQIYVQRKYFPMVSSLYVTTLGLVCYAFILTTHNINSKTNMSYHKQSMVLQYRDDSGRRNPITCWAGFEALKPFGPSELDSVLSGYRRPCIMLCTAG